MTRFDMPGQNRFDVLMRRLAQVLTFLVLLTVVLRGAEEAKVVAKVEPLPVALSDDFQFRKTKLFSLGQPTASATPSSGLPGKKKSPSSGSSQNAAVAEASINFEARYRNFGAVTVLDQRERAGDYFDFFWRAKRDARITVRLEYRQENLHAFTQAREVTYPNARGHHRTEFAVKGDDYYDDGRVIAWRCLLIENGRVVAENLSYLWR